MASQKLRFLRKLGFNFVEAALSDGLQPFLEKLIVITLPIPVPQTPHALYRAMFLYIVAAFGIGWFLPVNGVLWGILLATALVLYLRIRSLARGEKRLYDRFPAGKSGISSLQWLYLMIAVTGMVVAFYGGTAASYGELREARGIVPAKPYNARTECYARQEAVSQNEFVQFLLLGRPCRHVSGTNYLPFPNGGETLHLNCAANLYDSCELAYAHAGKPAVVKYSGSRLYEMEVDGVQLYRYAEQAARFNRERKAALLDALIALKTHHAEDGRLKYWRKRARQNQLPPVLAYELAALSDRWLILDGHLRLAAALAEGQLPPLIIIQATTARHSPQTAAEH